MISPFALPPEASAQAAAALIINKVHAYMRANPQSELHRIGKMFGVLVVEKDGTWQTAEGVSFIAAFSAGNPNESQPIGCKTLYPRIFLYRATTSPIE